MKTYTRKQAEGLDWNAIRATAFGIHSTPTEVIVYESADEIPPVPAKTTPDLSPIEQELAASPALSAIVDELAKLKKVTKEVLIAELAVTRA